MSLNIASDGSPTPRKGRFPATEDLRIDTSPETVGMAVGSRHPFPSRMTAFTSSNWRTGSPSLTSSVQGVKRPNSTSHDTSVPLATSARGNQGMPHPPQQLFPMTSNRVPIDGYKVSGSYCLL
jgi:hypothetical protein